MLFGKTGQRPDSHHINQVKRSITRIFKRGRYSHHEWYHSVVPKEKNRQKSCGLPLERTALKKSNKRKGGDGTTVQQSDASPPTK